MSARERAGRGRPGWQCGWHRSSWQRGQSLVEFAFVVPLFLLLLLGMLEFGIAFTHDQTLAYATREGARTGAALADGNTAYPCGTANFDAPIVAAVQRVLESPGSLVHVNDVTSLKIYLANPDGTASASFNTWVLAVGAGPTVDGRALDFKQTSTGWPPCSRLNGVNADGLGVSITYSYPFQTSLGGIFRFMFGTSWSSMTMSDKTVMNLNPTAQ